MTVTPEDTLMRYPDNIKDILNLGVGDMRFDRMTALHGAVDLRSAVDRRSPHSAGREGGREKPSGMAAFGGGRRHLYCE